MWQRRLSGYVTRAFSLFWALFRKVAQVKKCTYSLSSEVSFCFCLLVLHEKDDGFSHTGGLYKGFCGLNKWAVSAHVGGTALKRIQDLLHRLEALLHSGDVAPLCPGTPPSGVCGPGSSQGLPEFLHLVPLHHGAWTLSTDGPSVPSLSFLHALQIPIR